MADAKYIQHYTKKDSQIDINAVVKKFNNRKFQKEEFPWLNFIISYRLNWFKSIIKVVSIVSVMGKHTGNFFSFIPPSGNKICYRAVHVFTIGDDGKISEHKAIRDDLALMYQLGVVKATTPQYENLLKGWKG